MVGVVLLVAAPGLLSVALIDDPTGSHLELAPLFLAAAVAALAVRRHLVASRTRR